MRDAADAVQGLADEAGRKERALRQLLDQPGADAAAIGALLIELDACCKKIERIRRATLADLSTDQVAVGSRLPRGAVGGPAPAIPPE